jgi:hypothetical protein
MEVTEWQVLHSDEDCAIIVILAIGRDELVDTVTIESASISRALDIHPTDFLRAFG